MKLITLEMIYKILHFSFSNMFNFNIKKLTIKVLFYLVDIPEERDFYMLFNET